MPESEYAFSDFEPFGVFEFSDQEPITRRLYDSMRDMLGPAFQQPDQDAETFADAMCLGIAQLQLEAAGAQDDPDQISYMLAQVEKDYQIVAPSLATLAERRAALKAAMTAAHGALATVVFDGLETLLGDDFLYWRPTDFADEVELATTTPTFVPYSTPIKLVTLNALIWPGTRTVSYTRELQDGDNYLQPGDKLTVDPGKPGMTEMVTITETSVVRDPVTLVVTGQTLTATFALPHDSGVGATTGSQPLWVSTKCHSIVVVRSAVLDNPTQLAEIHLFMRKCMTASSTWIITDPEPYLDEDHLRLMVPNTLRIGQTVLAPETESVPVDPDDYLVFPTPMARWDLADATFTPSTVAQLHETDIDLWTKVGFGTVNTGMTGPVAGTTAVQIMQDSSTGGHSLNMGWSGTAGANTSILFEVIAKIIGGSGVYLWFRDAFDAVPVFKTNGAVISVIGGANSTAWTLDMQDYGADWYRYRMIAKGLFHTPVDPANAVEILMGDVSGYASIVGDPAKGVIIHRVLAHQNGELLTIPDGGVLGADLAGDGTYRPEYREPFFTGWGLPDMWAPAGTAGIAKTTHASILALYGSSSISTTAISICFDMAPTSPTSILLSRTDAASFSFGLTTNLTLWCGIYGTSGFTTVDPIPLGKHRLTVVKNGALASVYLDGELFCAPAAVTSATVNTFYLVVAQHSAITEARVWGSALTPAQVQNDALALLPRSCPVIRDAYKVWNGSLWDTRNIERLSFSESIWTIPGTATSVEVTYTEAFGAPSSGRKFGPSVYADGALVETIVLPGTAGSHTVTVDLPVGATSLVLRNGPRGSSTVTSYVTDISISGGAHRVVPSAPQHRLVVIGDSVGNGWNSTVPAEDGWCPRLKNERANGRVTLYGWGGYALFDEVVISGWDVEFPSRIAALCDGTASIDVLFTLCLNDASKAWAGGAAGYGVAVGAFIDAIHALLPTAHVWLLGPHICTNALGSAEAAVAPYRAALLAEETGRTAWCTAVDASAWTVAMDDTDATHLHPNTAGHSALFTGIQTALSWT